VSIYQTSKGPLFSEGHARPSGRANRDWLAAKPRTRTPTCVSLSIVVVLDERDECVKVAAADVATWKKGVPPLGDGDEGRRRHSQSFAEGRSRYAARHQRGRDE